jgi:hypothetical protein
MHVENKGNKTMGNITTNSFQSEFCMEEIHQNICLISTWMPAAKTSTAVTRLISS